ncbi:copper chaperone PCu(A)C [Streptomyces gobiensis]|uniref:copper chaperone PCu(A)C n=1 Tax=Streptomyces gobiensis TaxID=2875706 RepID=UPI001E3AA431|nr:copper chaperone PCu(A)C [Streptomyces gobiensis]UGY92488.1 copper chaperone PCu(A)C [Streptomyces gobiensis]
MIRHRTTLACAFALTAGLALGACSTGEASSGPQLKADGAYVPEPVLDTMAAGYVTLTNSGDQADKLTSVTSDLSDDVTLHKSAGNKMEQVKSFGIPANGELKLSRGGNHMMFADLKRKPDAGERVSVELHFEKSDPIRLDVPVEAKNYAPQK